MLEIPARIYSQAIWDTIKYRTKEYRDIYAFDTQMEYPATINEYSANMLRRLAFYFQPRVVAEVGTYIGRSTTALATGMGHGEIHTCDTGPQLFKAESVDGVFIKKYHAISTEMLKAIDKPVDLFFFDGRIQPDDLPLIKALAVPECVFLFDDFEGVEKGVANVMLAQQLGGILVLPEPGQTLAMMLRTKIGMTRQ
jgi:predicted O-methyltransferase YrrM